MSKEGRAISFAGNLTDQPEVRYTENAADQLGHAHPSTW